MYIFNAILLKIQLSLSEFKRLYLHSRLHHFASFFPKFSRGRPPEPPPTGGDTPPVPSPLGPSGLEKTPPGSVLDPPLVPITYNCTDYFHKINHSEYNDQSLCFGFSRFHCANGDLSMTSLRMTSHCMTSCCGVLSLPGSQGPPYMHLPKARVESCSAATTLALYVKNFPG